ncbi:MAG: hypothetical protein HYU66_13880 [Armatimonadetes bacterium]|nr:hypothetical protein [Armatimonadota bacterium]
MADGSGLVFAALSPVPLVEVCGLFLVLAYRDRRPWPARFGLIGLTALAAALLLAPMVPMVLGEPYDSPRATVLLWLAMPLTLLGWAALVVASLGGPYRLRVPGEAFGWPRGRAGLLSVVDVAAAGFLTSMTVCAAVVGTLPWDPPVWAPTEPERMLTWLGLRAAIATCGLAAGLRERRRSPWPARFCAFGFTLLGFGWLIAAHPGVIAWRAAWLQQHLTNPTACWPALWLLSLLPAAGTALLLAGLFAGPNHLRIPGRAFGLPASRGRLLTACGWAAMLGLLATAVVVGRLWLTRPPLPA